MTRAELAAQWRMRAEALTNDRDVMRDDRVKARCLEQCAADLDALGTDAPQEQVEMLERAHAALDAADHLMAGYLEEVLPARTWQNWRTQHRAALCDDPRTLPASPAEALVPKAEGK